MFSGLFVLGMEIAKLGCVMKGDAVGMKMNAWNCPGNVMQPLDGAARFMAYYTQTI